MVSRRRNTINTRNFFIRYHPLSFFYNNFEEKGVVWHFWKIKTFQKCHTTPFLITDKIQINKYERNIKI